MGKQIGWYKESENKFFCNNCFEAETIKDGYIPIKEESLKKDIYTCDKCRKEFNINAYQNIEERAGDLVLLRNQKRNESMVMLKNIVILLNVALFIYILLIPLSIIIPFLSFFQELSIFILILIFAPLFTIIFLFKERGIIGLLKSVLFYLHLLLLAYIVYFIVNIFLLHNYWLVWRLNTYYVIVLGLSASLSIYFLRSKA